MEASRETPATRRADLLPPTYPANEAGLAALEAHIVKQTSDPANAVILRFMPVGGAPVLKQNVFRLAAASPFQVVIRNLRKKLGMKAQEPLVRGATVLGLSNCNALRESVDVY